MFLIMLSDIRLILSCLWEIGTAGKTRTRYHVGCDLIASHNWSRKLGLLSLVGMAEQKEIIPEDTQVARGVQNIAESCQIWQYVPKDDDRERSADHVTLLSEPGPGGSA